MAAERFRTLEQDRWDAIVVGAGLGGLTTAALLAVRGLRVLVVDRHYVAGGNATVFRRRGYEFDVGLHYIGGCQPDGPIPRILRAAGATEVAFEELDPDGFDTLLFPGLECRIPRGIEALRARLSEAFPGERRGIDRWVRLLGELGTLQRAMVSPVSVLRAVPRCLLLLRHARGTLGAFLYTCTREPRLRAVIAGQNGDYALPPSRASLVVGAGLAYHPSLAFTRRTEPGP